MSEKPPPSYAPVYAAAMYPDLAAIFRRHGFALAVHGSLQRDFDLIAVPWVVEGVSAPSVVLAEVETTFAAKVIGTPTLKPHNRLAFTVSIGFGHCALDISFMPCKVPDYDPS